MTLAEYEIAYRDLLEAHNELKAKGSFEYREIDMIEFAKWFRNVNPNIDHISMFDLLSFWKNGYVNLNQQHYD
jgi:hypothetical protein